MQKTEPKAPARLNRSLFLAFLGLPFLSLGSAGDPTYDPHDRYPDFLALQDEKQEGRDYRVGTVDRGAAVTVFAIHGNAIEPGTAPIARALAGNDWNLYRFDAIPVPGQRTSDLHVTAKHFDDPRAVALAREALIGLSVHGEKGEGEKVCVGGANSRLASLIASALKAQSFNVEWPCSQFPAKNGKNIVNLARLGGVQFELTKSMRRALRENPENLKAFLLAIRGTVLSYLEGLPPSETRP